MAVITPLPAATKDIILSAYYESGTFYIELVTAALAFDDPTVADCTLATGGNYARKTGITLSASTSGADGTVAITSGNPQWIGLTTSGTPITGLIVVKQAGGAPASSDPVVAYVPLGTSSTVSTTTASGSVSASSSAAFGSVNEGDGVSGTGIAAGTYVLEKTSSSAIILSREATTTGTNSLTFTADSTYTPNGADFTFTLPSTILRI